MSDNAKTVWEKAEWESAQAASDKFQNEFREAMLSLDPERILAIGLQTHGKDN
jgi:hypothetical protein